MARAAEKLGQMTIDEFDTYLENIPNGKDFELIDDNNQRRPHSALGYLTPAAYSAIPSAACDRLRNPDQLSRSHVAPPAPHGVKPAEALSAAG